MPTPRRLLLICTLMASTAGLAGCDLPNDGQHRADRTYGSCTALDEHSRYGGTYASLTARQSGSTCNGVGAQLVYRMPNGEMYQNQWVWSASIAQAPQPGAVSSPTSLHGHCRTSSDCATSTY